MAGKFPGRLSGLQALSLYMPVARQCGPCNHPSSTNDSPMMHSIHSWMYSSSSPDSMTHAINHEGKSVTQTKRVRALSHHVPLQQHLQQETASQKTSPEKMQVAWKAKIHCCSLSLECTRRTRSALLVTVAPMPTCDGPGKPRCAAAHSAPPLNSHVQNKVCPAGDRCPYAHMQLAWNAKMHCSY